MDDLTVDGDFRTTYLYIVDYTNTDAVTIADSDMASPTPQSANVRLSRMTFTLIGSAVI